MNRIRLYRILTVILLVIGTVLVALSWRERLANRDEPREAGVAVMNPGAQESPIARAFGGASSGGSNAEPAVQQLGGNLFAESGTWLDQNGTERRLGDLRGHAVVFTFIYTTCDDACPLIVQSMKKGLAQVPEAARRGARFILFSFDPETDRPPVLADYAKKMELPGEQWLLLTAPDAQVKNIAAKVAFHYQRAGKHFSHNAVIGVATAQGEIVGWFADERITQAEELARGLTKALNL
jgi:protein SCO1/2